MGLFSQPNLKSKSIAIGCPFQLPTSPLGGLWSAQRHLTVGDLRKTSKKHKPALTGHQPYRPKSYTARESKGIFQAKFGPH